MSTKFTSLINMVRRYAWYNLGLRELGWRISKIVGDGTTTISIEGHQCRFYMETLIEYHRFKTLSGEIPVLRDICQTIRPNDVFFDIGANVGTYSCIVGATITDGQVFAFEPLPANYERLKQNIKLNDKPIEPINVALSDTQGTSLLTVGRNIAGAGGPRIETSSDQETVSIKVLTGDAFISELDNPAPDIIKIDVEGHEQNVLKGLKETISGGACRAIYCEIHSDRLNSLGYNEDDILDTLLRNGYEIEHLPIDRKIVKATPA